MMNEGEGKNREEKDMIKKGHMIRERNQRKNI